MDDTYPTVRYGVQVNNKMGQLYTGATERITAINEAYRSTVVSPLSCVHTGYVGPWTGRQAFSNMNQWGYFETNGHVGRVNVTMEDVSAIVRKVAELYETWKWVVRQELDATPEDGSLSTWYGPGAGIVGTVTNPPIDTLGGAMTRLGVGHAFLQVYDPVHFDGGGVKDFVTEGAGFFTVQPSISRSWVIGEVDSTASNIVTILPGVTNITVDFYWTPLHRNPTFYQVDINALVQYPRLYWRSDRPRPSGLTVYVAGSVYAISNDTAQHQRLQTYAPFSATYTVPAASTELTGDRWYSITNMTVSADPTNWHDSVQIAYVTNTMFGADATAGSLSHSTPAPVFGFAFTNVFNECQALIDNLVAFKGPEGFWTNSHLYGDDYQGSNAVYETYNVTKNSNDWWSAWENWRSDPEGYGVPWMPLGPVFEWPSLNVSEGAASTDYGITNNQAPHLLGTLGGSYVGEWSATWLTDWTDFWIAGVEDHHYNYSGWVERVESEYATTCPSTTQHSVELYCIVDPISTNDNPYPPVWVWTSDETAARRVVSDPISVSDVAAKSCVVVSTGTYDEVVVDIANYQDEENTSYVLLDDDAAWGANASGTAYQEAFEGMTPEIRYATEDHGVMLWAATGGGGEPSQMQLAGEAIVYEPDGLPVDGWQAWKNGETAFGGKSYWQYASVVTGTGKRGSVTITQQGITSWPSNFVVRAMPPLILLNGPNGLLYLER